MGIKKFLPKKKEVVEPTKLEVEYESVVESLGTYAADSEEFAKAATNLGLLGDEKRKEAAFNVEKEKWYVKVPRRIFEAITDGRVLTAVVSTIGAIVYAESCSKRKKRGELGQPEEMRDYKTRW